MTQQRGETKRVLKAENDRLTAALDRRTNDWDELRERLAENPGDLIDADQVIPAVQALQRQLDRVLAEMQERVTRADALWACKHKTVLRVCRERDHARAVNAFMEIELDGAQRARDTLADNLAAMKAERDEAQTDGSCAVSLAEHEREQRLQAEVQRDEARKERTQARGLFELSEEAIHEIREIVTRFGHPQLAFADDTVQNALGLERRRAEAAETRYNDGYGAQQALADAEQSRLIALNREMVRVWEGDWSALRALVIEAKRVQWVESGGDRGDVQCPCCGNLWMDSEPEERRHHAGDCRLVRALTIAEVRLAERETATPGGQ